MRIFHFDIVPAVDSAFLGEDNGFTTESFSESYNTKDDSIEIITCMHMSRIGYHIREVFPNLKCVITRTVGTDHIDKVFCEENGIRYFSVGQYGPHVIATHAFSLLLYRMRDLRACSDMIKMGTYDYSSVHALDLAGRKIGVIGVGNIGKHILRMAQSFGMELFGYDLYEDDVFKNEYHLQYTTLSEIYAQCDVICLACNLTSENHYMIDEDAIGHMKEGVVLINVARGELIDEDALLSHIEKFGFVGLDVISQESKAGIEKFRPFKNILITPHIAHFADSTVRNRWNKTYEIIHSL